MPTTTEMAGESELMKDRSFAPEPPPMEADAMERVKRLEPNLLTVLQYIEYFRVNGETKRVKETPDRYDSAFLSRAGRKLVYANRDKFELLFQRAGWDWDDVPAMTGIDVHLSEEDRERVARHYFSTTERRKGNIRPIRLDKLAAVITALDEYLGGIDYKLVELLADFKNGRSISDL